MIPAGTQKSQRHRSGGTRHISQGKGIRPERRSEIKIPKRPQTNHEAEDALANLAALAMPEPGGINLDQARRAERLQVAVDPANGDEEPE